jgi:glutamyl-tRNA reductase
MALACLGLSHHTAPAEVRERHAFAPSRMAEALVALCDYEAVGEAAMLSTCGRLEIYAELEDPELGILQLKQFLTGFGHAGLGYDIEPYLYTLFGDAAGEHLLRVATGLDSMLIGEAEILGQVKNAYLQAQRARSLGSSLHRLFREAIKAGRAARSQTTIGDDSVSIATAAIAMAKEHVGSLREKTIVLVGAGRMGEVAARRLKLEGANDVIVLNRSYDRARALVRRLGIGRAAALTAMNDVLAAADVVVTSTGAPHFMLTPEHIEHTMSARTNRPLFLIDIAVPRDVDPDVAQIPGVRIADIDQLAATVDLTLERRREAIPFVEEIITEHLARYRQWYDSRPVFPIIASLSRKAETIREGEVERIFARCPGLNDRDRMLITGMSLTIVSKLLHSAITHIREKAAQDQAEALFHARLVGEMFGLEEQAALPAAEQVPEPLFLHQNDGEPHSVWNGHS